MVGGVSGSRARLASLEALDPREGRWVALQPMAQPRSSCAAAALGGALYVAGGQCSAADVAAASAVTADAGGAWAASPPLRGTFGAFGTAGLTGYGGVGGGGGGLLGSSPPLAMHGVPVSSAAATVAGLYGSAPAGGASTAWLAGRAAGGGGGSGSGGELGVGASSGGAGFGVGMTRGLGAGFGGFGAGGGGGGMDEGSVHASMECYDVAAGRWRPCAPLGCGRSGLALCAV